jgi:hypothetical protein
MKTAFFEPMSRRSMLRLAGIGLGSIAFTSLLASEARASEGAIPAGLNPLAPKQPHFPARAKRVIFLFMPGGPSQVDTFDPKPLLTRDNGKPAPKLYLGQKRNLLASPWQFKKHGQCGMDVSELFPEVAQCVDELCLIRSMVADDPNHPGGCLQMNTGERVFSRPSMGSWITYGLGTENQNLPAYLAIGPRTLIEGARQYGSSFLPATYQGTFVSDLNNPIRDLKCNGGLQAQRQQLDALQQLNKFHAARNPDDERLEARAASFELAYRMQTEAPDAFNIDSESEATRKLYGIDADHTAPFGKQCLLARRLVERGVRFVQLYHTAKGDFQPWDQHANLKAGHETHCAATDRPIAGLLRDLRSRGLLKDTLVIWGGEFGRTPAAQGTDGRDHHPYGFSMWMAGGGVKGGHIHGATDDYGWDAVQDRVHVHDLHATILHLLGLDHERLTYRYAGRDYRLTDVSGSVVEQIIA